MIYADYAATAGFHPECVKEAVVNCLENPGNPGRGSHERAMEAARKIYDARCAAADFFDAGKPEQVAFNSGVTESLNMAVRGILCPGDRVVTTWAEHNSVLRPIYDMEKDGVDAVIASPDPEAIIKAAGKKTRMIIMSAASNVTGEVFDIAAVGSFCRENGIIFVVDSAQKAGVFPISMKKDNIDVLCFAGHKGLLGIQGCGGLCVSENVRIRPLVTGGSGIRSFDREHPSEMPTALEAGTANVPGIAALAAGIRYLKEKGMDRVSAKISEMYRFFYHGVSGISGVRIYGEYADVHTAAAALNIGSLDAAEAAQILDEEYGIGVRAGAHCAPLIHEHYGTVKQGMLRFSFGIGTEMSEIRECVRAVRELAEEFAE